MKTFWKTLLGGALGIGALYVVGKMCYEAGKEVGEVERQLEKQITSADTSAKTAGTDRNDTDGGEEAPSAPNEMEGDKAAVDRISEAEYEAGENKFKTKPTFIGNTVNKIKNLKLFICAKKAFNGGDRKPGVLATLLNNPEGARIEAFVKNGGVQINVQPNAA